VYVLAALEVDPDGADGCFITTCLICRYTLIQRNKRKDAAQMVDGVVVNRNENAFEDMTDLENPDFRYSI
jgi:hypothetical protein